MKKLKKKIQKRETSMPSTFALIVKKAKSSNKYQSKRIKQNSKKRNQILEREKRLNRIGWSLSLF